MADRFPIIIESNEQQIQELSAGDGLDLTRSGVVNANYVHSAGVNAGVVTLLHQHSHPQSEHN